MADETLEILARKVRELNAEKARAESLQAKLDSLAALDKETVERIWRDNDHEKKALAFQVAALQQGIRELLPLNPKDDTVLQNHWREALTDTESVARQHDAALIERCAKVADGWADSTSCDQAEPCEHKRTGAGIAAAIRKLAS